jgi:hypothetical protein
VSALLQPVISLGAWLWGFVAAAVVWVVGQESAPQVLDSLLLLLKTIALIVCIVVPLLLSVAYLTLWERKLIGWMQIRIGPNRVTFFGISWLGGRGGGPSSRGGCRVIARAFHFHLSKHGCCNCLAIGARMERDDVRVRKNKRVKGELKL